MLKSQIPNYSIDRVKGDDPAANDLMATRFGEYLSTRDYLLQPHRHSFYHMVYFSKGAGRHSIDFVSFPVSSGQMYFMNPGQVHHWEFAGEVDGYIINFSPRFFQLLLSQPDYLDQFSFFSGSGDEQVANLPIEARQQVTDLMEKILEELRDQKEMSTDMIRFLLLEIFIMVGRVMSAARPEHNSVPRPGLVVLRNFRRLIGENFMKIKLPKDYAALLYVTPNYLNSLCQDILGIPAGEVIRERIVLEAKRLLVNAGLSITQIAYRLNFQDSSYFTKFFKKHAGMTPEEFRKLFHL
jgi:AraC family transcriptional regulator, transcriptional activator of pobA